MSYRLVRVNTDDHTTRARAFADMVSIIERGYYWKKSRLPSIPAGTQIVGMGSHGGQGLFIIGIATSDEWEDEPDGDVFKHRLPVAWARVVYENPDQLDEIKSIPGAFNERFGAEMDHDEHRRVLALVMAAEALDMYDE